MTSILRSVLGVCLGISVTANGAELSSSAVVSKPARLSTDPPLGPEGGIASYQIEDSQPGQSKNSTVREFTVGFGPVELGETSRVQQWLRLHATKGDGSSYQCWLLCDRYPPESVVEAEQVVARYILQEGQAEPLEFCDRRSGRAVLPLLGAWKYLIPRGQEGAKAGAGFAEVWALLGHRYSLQQVENGKPGLGPPRARRLNLLSDAWIGVPHNTRQANDTRRYDGSDYELVRLTRPDFDAMIQAGMNCFYVDAEQRRWIEHRDVYYWGGSMAEMPYPECLYRSTYLGPALFLDEPAVVTRDYVIRPRLKEEPEFGRRLTPQLVRDAFLEHFRKAKYDGAPAALIRGLSGRADVDVGNMSFLQQNLFTWETMISTGLDQLSEGGTSPPSAIVFEPPGHLGTRRTLPEMDMVYGCQLPVDNPAHLAGILYGFLRGAARLSGKEWGTSIYGAVDQADSPWLLTYAYDLGATRFFYWDSAALACVPFRECLTLSRHLRTHIESYPRRDLDRLKRAAESLILLPPGYNLGHVHMGKGSLWGLGELNLERTNRFGVSYRAVMHNLFTEIERCIRLGTAYDLAWDLPGLQPSGYREVVHVGEDGSVQVLNGAGSTHYDGPRIPARPSGEAPGLAVELTPERVSVGSTITALAKVSEHSTPVFYTARRDSHGVYQNAVVFWELFGPSDEDYRILLTDGVQPRIQRHGTSCQVEISFQINSPGVYRLRAAVADAAGRSTVVWKRFTVR